MPAFGPIILVDGASTPVNHTYTPNGRPGGIAEYCEKDGVPVGDNTLTIGTKHGAREKISLRLKCPIVVSATDTSGVANPQIVRTSYVRIDFDFAATSTTQERKDVVSLAASALGASQTAIRQVLVDLQDVF